LAESTEKVAESQPEDELFDLDKDLANVVPLVVEKGQSRESA
jgi:hypothetical protein